ncbi:hypothetical protein K438DRAFT_1857127 [Mycena galopus ATCC 62051]|nr:hypothetical protein K438DRAFT_1857127 [Mycena galopus ATCC 62051]
MGVTGLQSDVASSGTVAEVPVARHDVDSSWATHIMGRQAAEYWMERFQRNATQKPRFHLESKRPLHKMSRSKVPRSVAEEMAAQRTTHLANYATGYALRAKGMDVYFSLGENDDPMADNYAVGCLTAEPGKLPSTLPRCEDADLLVKSGNPKAAIYTLRKPQRHISVAKFLAVVKLDEEPDTKAGRTEQEVEDSIARRLFDGLACLVRLSPCDVHPIKSCLADLGPVTRMPVWAATPAHIIQFADCQPDLVTGRYDAKIADNLIKRDILKEDQRTVAVARLTEVEIHGYETPACVDIKDGGKDIHHAFPRIFLFTLLQIGRMRAEWGPGDGSDLSEELLRELKNLLNLRGVVAERDEWHRADDPVDPISENQAVERISGFLLFHMLRHAIDQRRLLAHLRQLEPTVMAQLEQFPIPPFCWQHRMMERGERHLEMPWPPVELDVATMGRFARMEQLLLPGEQASLSVYERLLTRELDVSWVQSRQIMASATSGLYQRLKESSDFALICTGILGNSKMSGPRSTDCLALHYLIQLMEENAKGGVKQAKFWIKHWDAIWAAVARRLHEGIVMFNTEDPGEHVVYMHTHFIRGTDLENAWDSLGLSALLPLMTILFPDSYGALLRDLGLPYVGAWTEMQDEVEDSLRRLQRAWKLDRKKDETFNTWAHRVDLRLQVQMEREDARSFNAVYEELIQAGVAGDHRVVAAPGESLPPIPGWAGDDRNHLLAAVATALSTVPSSKSGRFLCASVRIWCSDWCRSPNSVREFIFDTDVISALSVDLPTPMNSTNAEGVIFRSFLVELGLRYQDGGRLADSLDAAHFATAFDEDGRFHKLVRILHTHASLTPLLHGCLNEFAQSFTGSRDSKSVPELQRQWKEAFNVHMLMDMVVSFAGFTAEIWETTTLSAPSISALTLCWAGHLGGLDVGQSALDRYRTRPVIFLVWLTEFTGFRLRAPELHALKSACARTPNWDSAAVGTELQVAAFCAVWAPRCLSMWEEGRDIRRHRAKKQRTKGGVKNFVQITERAVTLVQLFALCLWCWQGDLSGPQVLDARLTRVRTNIWCGNAQSAAPGRPRFVKLLAECGTMVSKLLTGALYVPSGEWIEPVQDLLDEAAALSSRPAPLDDDRSPQSLPQIPLFNVEDKELATGCQLLWREFQKPRGGLPYWRPDESSEAFARMLVTPPSQSEDHGSVALMKFVLTNLEETLVEGGLLKRDTGSY